MRKNSLLRMGLHLLTVLLLFAAFCVPSFAQEAVQESGKACSMALIYGIVAVLSLVLVFGYCVLVKRKELWFLLLFIAVFVVNLGYFALAISRTLEEAMLANRIAYLGSIFLPLCMLMIIMNVCDMRPNRVFLIGLICVSIATFLLAASGGYLQVYYKSVSLKHVDGVATLEKVYGPLHKLYFVYLFAYFGMMVGVIVHSVRKKKAVPQKYATILAVLALWNIAIWLVEQLIEWDFEFLSVSYIATELLLLLLYDMMREYSMAERSTTIYESPSEDETPVEPSPAYELLTSREKEVLKLLLEGKKRKEIAEELFVTENTVKKHTAHIYEKLEVSGRSELMIKLKNG